MTIWQPEMALLAAIATGSPPLPDAAGIGYAPAFDEFSLAGAAVPLQVCRHCPELAQSWYKGNY